jgi:hypothetical protein
MDYKEKYEHALERARQFGEKPYLEDSAGIVEYIFPELKESEDEKIRKALVKYFTSRITNPDYEIYGIPFKEVLAWLEKQGAKVSAIEGFETEFERQVSGLIASAINKEHEYNQGYVKWTANALLNYAKRELEKQGQNNMGISEATKKKLEDNLNKALEKETSESLNKFLSKQGEQTSDKIVEKARTEKQRILLTETDGSANIDWDCRSLDDVKILLKCGLEFIRTIEANKQMPTESRFSGCSFRVPTRYDKGVKQGGQKPAEWSEEDERNLNDAILFIKT